MINDYYFTIFISIIIIIILLSKTHIYVRNQSIVLHFAILLFIVFLFYTKYEKSAFMTSLLYLIVYTQSYKIKEYFDSSPNLPPHSLNATENPNDKKSIDVKNNNIISSQCTVWFNGDSFDVKDNKWRDLENNNHITFTSTNVKLNKGVFFPSLTPTDSKTNNSSTELGTQKWVSGDTTAQFSIPLSSSNGITFIHLTRYSPRTINRGKIWSSPNGTCVSGYNDNKFTVTDTNGTDLPNISSNKIGDIMNIRGSNWNLFIDIMNIAAKTRTVHINGSDYIFETTAMQSIPDKIGINIHSGDKSDWDCAEIILYSRILETVEIQKMIDYFNKKYGMKYPDKIEAKKYNIYNHFTFSSTPDSDWQSPLQVGSIKSSGNKLLGITDSEYECVSLCDKSTESCNAFSYHMEKGACYLVNENNILNHTTSNKAILSGTNKEREVIAVKVKEEAERKAREEAERKAKEAAAQAAAEAAAASAQAAAQAKAQAAAQAAQAAAKVAEKRALIANNTSLAWFNKQYYVNVQHKPELNISIGDFCIECWYYENTHTGNNTIVDKGDYSFLFQVRPNGQSSIGFYNRSTGWWYAPGNIPSNQWVHLAINYSRWNRTMAFYMNGNFIGSGVFGSYFTATDGVMSIGRQSPDTCDCNILNNATLFDLRLWNWFRSQDQIQNNMYRKIEYWTNGLVANYMMTYRYDLVIYDETTRNHGNLTGSFDPYYVYRKISLPYTHDDIPYDSQQRWNTVLPIPAPPPPPPPPQSHGCSIL